MFTPALFIIMRYHKLSRCSIPRNGCVTYDITIELTLKMTFPTVVVHPNTAEKHTPNTRRAQCRCDFQEGVGRGGEGGEVGCVCFLVSMDNNYFRRMFND